MTPAADSPPPVPTTSLQLGDLDITQAGELREREDGSWDLQVSMTGDERAQLPQNLSRAKYVGIAIGRPDGGVRHGKAHEIDYAASDRVAPTMVTIKGWRLDA